MVVACTTSAPKPAPLAVSQEEVSFASVKGTLYLPASDKPSPAIVVLHASGGGTRDFPAYQHLVRELPQHGFAVLLYDRRADFRAASFRDLAMDAVAGVELLKQRADIDPKRIGVWGVSQGAWLAPLAATLSPDVAFVVAVSGPGVSPAKQMDYTASYALRHSGQPAQTVARALDVREKVNRYYRGQSGKEEAEGAVASIRRQPWFQDVSLPNGGNLPDDPTKTKWYLEMDYEPLDVLERVTVPAIFFFAEDDPYVPVEESIGRVRRAMPRAAIVRVPGTGHYMEELATPAHETSPRYVSELLKWLAQR